MPKTVELSPFFERAGASIEGFPAERYVAGYRAPGDDRKPVQITLPAELVERAVLTGGALGVSLSTDGRLMLHADGLDDEALQAASSGIDQQTLETLIASCLDTELLAGEDDAVGDLTVLRGQLVRSLAKLDETLERQRTVDGGRSGSR